MEINLFLSLGLGSNFGNESSSRVAWQEDYLKKQMKQKGNQWENAAF